MSEVNEGLPFKRNNYYLFIGGAAFVILGFILMIGGEPTDPSVFNPEVFSPMRITVAPLLILSGFAVIMVGIFKRFK